MKPDLVRGHLDLLILAMLKAGPAHGYAVISGLAARSNGVFEFPEGTVYPALQRLEREGLIASDWESESGRKRRVYRLTDAGLDAFAMKSVAWMKFSGGMQSILGHARLMWS